MSDQRYENYDSWSPVPYDPDFQGPLKQRSCTDVICLMIFLLFIGCWAGIGLYAFTTGDPYTLLVPKDSSGSRCGLDEHVKDRPYLFFFDLTKCFGPTVPLTGCPTTQVCVKKCPSEVFDWDTMRDYTKLICNYGVSESISSTSDADRFVEEKQCARWYLPSTSLLNRCLYTIADRKKLKGDIGRKRDDEISEINKHLNKIGMWLSLFVQNALGYFTENEQYLQNLLSITPFPPNFKGHTIEKRCVPIVSQENFNKISQLSGSDYNQMISSSKNIKALSQAEQVGQNIVDDVISSWWKILIGVGVAVLISIIYIVILRWLAGPMVWLSLLGTVALLVAAVYFTSVKYKDLIDNPVTKDETNNVLESYATKKETWLLLLIISSVVLGIVLLMLVYLRKRILLAIALIKEGSEAVGSVTSVLFFPLFPWLLQIGVIAFALSTALYLATTGEPTYKIRGMTPQCSCLNYQEGGHCVPERFKHDIVNCIKNMSSCESVTCKFITMKNPSLYPWLQAFNVVGFFWGTFFVSAMGQMILASVFATWYWTHRNLPFFATLEATGRVLRYHVGTLAFGSLIITICRLIRLSLEYIDHKLKKWDNEFTKAILCCCKCFFWCLEKFLKFINRNAYIMCAIHGKNFCTSAKDAFMLLMRNIIRVFVLDKVTDFLFFLGKLFITVGVGALAYFFFVSDITAIDNSDLHYEVVPVIVIMIITYFIATMFFNVYSMAVDTLFLCFLEDCERNDGSPEKPYRMSKNLMNILGKKNKRD